MFSTELIHLIEKAEGKRNKAVSDFRSVSKRYKLTEEGARDELEKQAKDTRAAIDPDIARGLQIIDSKIEAVKAAEIKEAERRALDASYLERLNLKCDFVVSISAKDETVTADYLKIFFSEFENDPLAISRIRQAVAPHGMEFVDVIPADHTGEKAARMEGLKKDFISAMEAAATLTYGNLAAPVIIENLKKYISEQDTECGLDPVKVWGLIRAKEAAKSAAASSNGNGAPAPASTGSFAGAFNFSQVRV